jgi:hypothetical protein
LRKSALLSSSIHTWVFSKLHPLPAKLIWLSGVDISPVYYYFSPILFVGSKEIANFAMQMCRKTTL